MDGEKTEHGRLVFVWTVAFENARGIERKEQVICRTFSQVHAVAEKIEAAEKLTLVGIVRGSRAVLLDVIA